MSENKKIEYTYQNIFLIYVKKVFKGGFTNWVLVGSYKNRTIANHSLKKMINAGIDAKIVCPQMPKPVGW